jgi:imidazolonepropionase
MSPAKRASKFPSSSGAHPARLYVGISQLVQPLTDEGASREPLRITENAGLHVARGRVVAAGPVDSVLRGAHGVPRVDLEARAVVPGLVDSHTHTVFAGERIDEFSRRSRGQTYAQIQNEGGGILNTVRATRAASHRDLVQQTVKRLAAMFSSGTTTCEVKSGYGLTPRAEIAQLLAVADASKKTSVSLLATALAHMVPPEHRGQRQAYVDEFCQNVIVAAAQQKLAQFADVFVEQGAFSPDEARQIARVAKSCGLKLKLHVDQLHDGNGALLAAELGALSADHLEHVSTAGRAALATKGVVATLLPGCALFSANGLFPDGRALRESGCEVAVATDFNPGSSMVTDLALCGAVAATQCRLSLEEALWAITRGGAKALGLNDRGTLSIGERADFVVVDHADWRWLFYELGGSNVFATVAGDRAVRRSTILAAL